MYVLTLVGMTLYETLFGIYVLARGRYTYKESLKRLFKIPILYALVLGLIFNVSGIKLGGVYENLLLNITGAYAVLGIMILGISMSEIRKTNLDFKFISLALLYKFIFWPLIICAIIYIDSVTSHIFSDFARQILLLISIVPLPGNSVAFATEFKIFPEKMATAVLISTIFALIYIPIFVALFF